MPKKKRTQQKPVPRGFAVTSIPKKVPPELLSQSNVKGESSSSEISEVQNAQHHESVEDEALTRQKAEEQPLQDLVDRMQDKTEKEITRAVKAIETERRFSRNLPLLDLDTNIVGEILAMARDSGSGGGYSEETVERCLESIDGVDLEEAYEWLFMHCADEELQSHTLLLESKTSMPKPKSSITSPVPSDSARTTSHMPGLTPSTFQPNRDAGLFSSSGPPDDDDDPNIQYTRLRGNPTDSLIEGLHSRLRAVKLHYLFDERDAEARYLSERRKAESNALRAHLRDGPDMSNTKPWAPTPPDIQPPSHPLKEVHESPGDIFSLNGEEDGGLLEILDDIPSTDVTETGATVRVRDMPLPRGKFERTSKAFLQAAVKKLDGFAVTTYHPIPGASRAKRASVTVRWSSGEIGEWTMTDVACYDMDQAEQYIATVALHALTFPASAGFASGNSAPGTGQTFFRLLSPAFRELWDELEATRKDSDDATNRAIWAKLKKIVEAKRNRGKLHRLPKESQRNKLPIAYYRDQIVECLETSQVLVLSGETGCGKSTQVPAFILEDQLSRGNACKVYCAEPRRISAISLAHRVSQELGDPPGAVGTPASLVGYSVRLENHTTRNTRLAYITYGIALRMLEGSGNHSDHGIAFDEITHIIIDEVHERSIESDFLLIVLKALLLQRPDLRVVLMSATIDSEKISQYFGNCPVIHVPGRTFPVDVKYLEDVVELTQWSVTESSPYAKRLNDKFFRGKNAQEWSEDTVGANLSDHDDDAVSSNVKLETRYSPRTTSTINLLDERVIPYDLILRLLGHICFQQAYAKYSAAILIFLPGIGEIRRLNDLLAEDAGFGSSHNFVIYILHSSISSENQGAVFDVPPPGIRKIVLATNIAETGITIPDITCVIDSGKHKEMRFDEKRQFSRLVETYVAKSNAAQRRGRSGRVQEGLCFHLFTKIRHDTQLADQPDPEIMRLSLSDLALRIKILKVDLGSSIEDVLSRALDPPSPLNIQRAVSALVEVRALTPDEEITPLGRLLSALPTDVHIGKFLLMATVFRCLDPALTIAATLNSKSPFLTPFGHEEEADRAKSSFRTDNSDFLTMHNAFASWRRASSDVNIARKFCRLNFLSQQNLQQIEELRQQFFAYLIDAKFIEADKAFVKQLSRTRFNRYRSRFVMLPPELDIYSENTALINAALTAGLYPKILSIDQGQLYTITNARAVAFHPSSVNFNFNFKRKPQDFGVNFLTFFTIMHSKKLYVWETGPVDDVALLLLCGDCNFRPVSDTASVDRKIKFRIPAKANLALKYLRNQLAIALGERLGNQPSTGLQEKWMEMALIVLGKLRLEQDRNEQTIARN
ncbi:P-loop containing nucleoside triphosphate hydrolase protein [Multifurca ochricompacta]|uniref:RNA helicase n=1 Tax=Multifurca ochricompacta TaxID=376703 RepID=A0AAD4MDU4_9AGAM|nr:P-loop containing nucleoside triphosphate hydrolase protein [Multifurca ochricompacta]